MNTARNTSQGAVATLLLTALLSLGGACRANPEELPSIPFEAYRLDNGLKVILHEDHRLPLVAVNLWYHVGSKDEPPGRSGFAHLFEHLMFRGTKNVPHGVFDRLIEGSGGSNNASTTLDRTNYFEHGPSNLLETFLFLEADRLKSLGRDITQEDLDTEREVVRNERRQNFEDRPYAKGYLERWPNLYPPGHPYHHAPIGSHTDLENATLEDVKEFFARYYMPSNASLVVAGDLDPPQAREWIEKYFGPIPSGTPPRPVTAPPQRLDRQKIVTLTDRVTLPMTQILYHSPAFYADGDADLDVASEVLAGGKASRLHRRLVREKRMAQAVAAMQSSHQLGSVYTIQAVAMPGQRLEDLEAEIDRVVAELSTTPPTAKEIQRARNQIETMFWHQVETVSGRADLLNSYQFYFGDPGALARDLERYRRVTSASVRRWVENVVRPDGRLIIRVLPEERLEAHPQPEAGPLPVVQAPRPETSTLANGVPIWHVRTPQVPLVSVSLMVPAGAAQDPPGQAGLASLTADMLDEGAGERSAVELADAVDILGATLGVSSGRESSELSLQTVRRNLAPALDLFADVLLRPRFEETEWKPLQARTINRLRQARDDARHVSRLVSYRILYGDDHPYGSPETGYVESVESIQLSDIKTFHEREWKASGAHVVSAGDISLAELKAMLDERLGAWRAPKGAGREPPPSFPDRDRPRLVLVNKPDATQTVVRVAAPGITRRDPDYTPLSIANNIFGGSFTSRINQNLRVEKSFTYGAGSDFSRLRGQGLYICGASVHADKTGESIRELAAEYRRLAADGITPEELEKARATLRNDVIERLQTVSGTARLFLSLAAAELPPDALANELEAIREVDADRILAAIQRTIRWDRSVVLLVGDLEILRAEIAEIEDLGLGEPLVVDEEGAVVE